MFRKTDVVVESDFVMIENQSTDGASVARKDVKEDFVGHLDFRNKNFWEKLCLYKLFLGERPCYPGQINELYPSLKWRYDLLLLTKLLRR